MQWSLSNVFLFILKFFMMVLLKNYDVTGKNCPKYYVENPDAWIQMKSDIAAQIDVDYGLQDVQ